MARRFRIGKSAPASRLYELDFVMNKVIDIKATSVQKTLSGRPAAAIWSADMAVIREGNEMVDFQNLDVANRGPLGSLMLIRPLRAR